MIFEWHQSAWDGLVRARENLHHALLLRGPEGTGKLRFAKSLAAWLLCEAPFPRVAPCGTCPSCRWVTNESHPDFREIGPQTDEDGGEGEGAAERRQRVQITIAQIRELADFLNVSSHRQGARVVLIHPADALNPNAANALLKSLEEPPANVFFLLVTHRPQVVLPTIVSRCRQFALPPPRSGQSEKYLADNGVTNPKPILAVAGGAPLLALQLEDPQFWSQHREFAEVVATPAFDALAAAERLKAHALPQLLARLQRWSYDLMLSKTVKNIRYFIDFQSAIDRISSGLVESEIARFHRSMVRMQRVIHHPLNQQLVLETLMLAYARLLQGDIAQAPGTWR